MKSFAYLPFLLLLILGACSKNSPEISGEIKDADNQSLMLEKSDYAGVWIPIDSTRTDSKGKFKIEIPRADAPEIYRLRLADRYVYFPVDSTEKITLSSSVAGYGRDFALSGSAQAEQMARFEMALQRASLALPDSAEAFRKYVYTEYIREGHGNILSYYVLTKVLPDGRLLFNPESPSDARYFAAVATQMAEYRPEDPRTEFIREISLRAMKNRNSVQGKKTVITANEVKMIDVTLQDENGRDVALSSVVGKGKPVLMVFAMMNAAESPAFNRRLAAWSKNHPDTAIYHISFDEDIYAWREAARNLPWTTVIDPGGMSSTVLSDYNVDSLPAYFLYDAAGNLAERLETI